MSAVRCILRVIALNFPLERTISKNFLQNQKRVTKISCELVTRYYILWLWSEPGYETSSRIAAIGALELKGGMQMQLVTDTQKTPSVAGANVAEMSPVSQSTYPEYRIIRRNGAVVGFDPGKISVAMTKAFLAIEGGQGAASARIRELVAGLTEGVVAALARRQPGGGTFHIEDIQDQVELALMRSGEHEVARAYVLYREQRTKARALEQAKQ